MFDTVVNSCILASSKGVLPAFHSRKNAEFFYMNSQNIFEMLSDDPVEFNLKSLKAKLAIALVALIREKGWNQSVAAERLQVTQPRMSNLFRGRLEKFSIDALLGMLIRSGYKVESSFDPDNVSVPVSLEVRKAML
jgi:predicted XRE-type DNA-binding protein